MSINIAGINIGEAIINLEYELLRTQRILEYVLNNNLSLKKPNIGDISQISKEVLKIVQKKYPSAGIKLK